MALQRVFPSLLRQAFIALTFAGIFLTIWITSRHLLLRGNAAEWASALKQIEEVAASTKRAPGLMYWSATEENGNDNQITGISETMSYSEGMPEIFPNKEDLNLYDEITEPLPDVIHIPFEEAVADIELRGWEDEWLAEAHFDVEKWGGLDEPKIDFVYNWVNGSDEAFRSTKYEYELKSTLNDPQGEWLRVHSVNRYRDWDELRYSFRSIEKYASTFLNKIQILVNTVRETTPVEDSALKSRRQKPDWLNDDRNTKEVVQVLAQEDFFGEEAQRCLPTFNSMTIENQIHNTQSDVDNLFALSDDMLLGSIHAASDIYSPLFGPTMGFKTDWYNVQDRPDSNAGEGFGEKPYLLYTSWLLNRRFGQRKRKCQVHFGHSLSRRVTREAMDTFPGPSAESACNRFRGELGFHHLYTWFATFHYTIERHREALLWSYIMLRSDSDDNGDLSWEERQRITADIEEGKANEQAAPFTFRERLFFQVPKLLSKVGLEPPKANINVLWTSLDGPATIQDLKCLDFDIDECLADGFSSPSSDKQYKNPNFSAATVFDRLARKDTRCGDCLIKLVLSKVRKGLSPMLPHAHSQSAKRAMVIKALVKYQYTIIDPDAAFFMVKDAEQAQNVLLDRFLYRSKQVGQICLNDDVMTEEADVIHDVKEIMSKVYLELFPDKSLFEIAD